MSDKTDYEHNNAKVGFKASPFEIEYLYDDEKPGKPSRIEVEILNDEGPYEFQAEVLYRGTTSQEVLGYLQDQYEEFDVLRMRNSAEELEDNTEISSVDLGRLTDRQREALGTALNEGYYEFPREITGEELSETLDIAPPTAEAHIRKAERKIFEQLDDLEPERR